MGMRDASATMVALIPLMGFDATEGVEFDLRARRQLARGTMIEVAEI